MDETLALPSEKAAQIALRTQQLIAYETGVANVVDPLGGSWYIEDLTDKIELECEKYFKSIDELGGVINCIETGFFQKEIAYASSVYQSEVENENRYIVGINKFKDDDETIDIPILEISKETQNSQINKLEKTKEDRDVKDVNQKLNAITDACHCNDNLMPLIIDAAKAKATLEEIVDSMKSVFGEWTESSII